MRRSSWCTQILGLLATTVVLWRVALVARYRPVPEVGDARLPRLTVIVPAYNEGRQVLSTLRSLALSRYPRERLQLIAVDDGSQDDTWAWIRRGAEELGPQLTTVRCARNGGKKHALAEGIRRATGEIVVTVDSDSEVLPDTLRLLVAPLVIDSRAVRWRGTSGSSTATTGVLPRMLDACFTSSFDFGRAGESEVGGVMCCPGALSAWRTRMLRGVLDEWLGQTFFGQPAAIGEDRALTNLVLRSGATVRYQSTAIVLTQVPTTLRVLCKMLLRWARSNVRESLVLGSFIFRIRGPHGRAAARTPAALPGLRAANARLHAALRADGGGAGAPPGAAAARGRPHAGGGAAHRCHRPGRARWTDRALCGSVGDLTRRSSPPGSRSTPW